MSDWRDDEPVDVAGLPLREHAARLAELLDLDEEQRGVLVAELRNALLPALCDAERTGATLAARGIERVLALADAVSRRGGLTAALTLSCSAVAP